MGAGASRKYVEEIRAATQADVARACAELSTQDKDKLIGLLEASEQVRSQSSASDPTLEHARGTPGVQHELKPGHSDSPEGAVQQDLAPGHSESPEGAVAKKEPRSVPRSKVEASGCEAPTGVSVDPGKGAVEPAPTPATKTASSDEKNEERKVCLPVQVQYCVS